MSVSLLLAVLLGAPPPDPIKLAMPGLTTVNLDAKAADLYADYFAQHLASAGGIRVTTKTEVASLLGLERQKEMLGCADVNTSCLAELSGALGVEGVVVGSLGKLGSEYVSTLKIVSAKDGHILADASTRARDESELLDWMAKTATVMAKSVLSSRASGSSSADVHVDASAPSLRSRAWIPAALGGALAIAGGIFYGLAAQRASTLETGRGTYATVAQLDQAVKEGATFQTVGLALLGTGVAAAAVGLGLFLLGGEGGESAALMVGPSGLVLTGSWP